MSKKLILTHDVNKLGSLGDVVVVKNGYARNFLLPQRLAIAWSLGEQKQLDKINIAKSKKTTQSLEELEQLRKELESRTFIIFAKADKKENLFGSVRLDLIIKTIKSAGFTEMDKRFIKLSSPIKKLGNYLLEANLGNKVVAKLNLNVLAENQT